MLHSSSENTVLEESSDRGEGYGGMTSLRDRDKNVGRKGHK